MSKSEELHVNQMHFELKENQVFFSTVGLLISACTVETAFDSCLARNVSRNVTHYAHL